MSNTNKLNKIFSEALGVEPSIIKDDLQYNTIRQWDSIAHMSLITAIEDAFDVMLDTSDIIDMNSVAKAKEIIGKHGVIL